MMRAQILALGLAVALLAGQASAATVGFQGSFATAQFGGGAGSAFGAVPPPVSFALGLTIADSAGPVGTITGGTLVSGGVISPIAIVGGTVTLIDNGASDTVDFVLQVANGGGAANGIWNFAFLNADFLTGTTVDQNAFNKLMNKKAMASLLYTDGGNGQFSSYAGSITAVPEPGSLALMLGVVCGVAGWRRRRA